MIRLQLVAIVIGLMLTPAIVQGESASTIPQAALIQPADLANEIESGMTPTILQVGFSKLYAQSHIPGAIYAGPTNDKEGIQNLREQVQSFAKDKRLVIYCGCCPWTKCPNIAEAWKELRAEGFNQVKVLYLAENFGADWLDKGYPATHGS